MDKIHENTQQAEEVAIDASSGIPKRRLTDLEISRLADAVIQFSQSMCGIELYPYEEEFGWRIAYSVLREDADEITALFSRQSGKTETVAVVVCGMAVMLPSLAKHLEHDERLAKFKNGLWCGIYAPGYDQAGIMWARMKTRMYSKKAISTLLDPDINMDLSGATENLVLPNGSFVDCGTAAPQAKIEGKTYHLILLEESQDIVSSMMRSAIHPMAAATAGTLVKIGTCNRLRSDFYDACRRNKRSDVNNGRVRSKYRLHYEYDYTVAQKYNKKYRKYVEKEKMRLGEGSDDFRMKYRLHWMLERGMFINPDLFDECGIKGEKQSLYISVGRGRRKRKIEFKRPPNVVTFDSTTPNMVAAIDVGREASTVITVGKVFWDSPIQHGDSDRYPIHVMNWLELYGDDHEAQHPQILDFLKNYQLSDVIVDATGKGDPVYSRLAADLDKVNIQVTPFVFTAQSKDIGYKVFSQEISTRRFTFPAGSRASRLQKWQKFCGQMYDLQKDWRGQRMVVSKPKDSVEASDDFCDSAMMLCWAVNVRGTMEIEEGPNPFLGRESRWVAAEMFKNAGAWYRKKMDPRFKQTRKGHRGRWD